MQVNVNKSDLVVNQTDMTPKEDLFPEHLTIFQH